MTTWLVDGNILVALVLEKHEFHLRSKHWLEALKDPFATCTITQGTLLRLHMKLAADPSAGAAWRTLSRVVADPLHVFWEDGFSYLDVDHALLLGPKQVTDAWLATLARKRKGKVATLDAAFASLHRDVAVIVPAW